MYPVSHVTSHRPVYFRSVQLVKLKCACSAGALHWTATRTEGSSEWNQVCQF